MPDNDDNVIPLAARLPVERPPSTRPDVFINTLDQIVDEMWDDTSFKRLLDTMSNKFSVHGSYLADRTIAAMQVKARATERNLPSVASAKLTKIMRGFETLLRRNKLGRKRRTALLHAPQAAE